jgi:hypothetical protein
VREGGACALDKAFTVFSWEVVVSLLLLFPPCCFLISFFSLLGLYILFPFSITKLTCWKRCLRALWFGGYITILSFTGEARQQQILWALSIHRNGPSAARNTFSPNGNIYLLIENLSFPKLRFSLPLSELRVY